MIKVTVNINGKDYNLKGRDDEKYLKQVAEYVDEKINEIKSKNQFLSTGDAAVLAAVNIVDQLYENDIEYQETKKVKLSLEERNQTLSDTIKELRERIEILQEENKNQVILLNKEIEDKTLEIDNLRETIMKLSVEKEEAKKIVNESKYNESVLNKELESLKNSNNKLNSDIQKLLQSKKSLKEEINNTKNSVNELEEKNRKLNNQILQKDKVIEINNQSKMKLKEEFENERIHNKEIMDSEIDKREALILEMQEKIEKLSSEKSTILESGKQSRKELRDAKYKILDLEKKIVDVQIEMAKLKRDTVLRK